MLIGKEYSGECFTKTGPWRQGKSESFNTSGSILLEHCSGQRLTRAAEFDGAGLQFAGLFMLDKCLDFNGKYTSISRQALVETVRGDELDIRGLEKRGGGSNVD